MRGLAYREKHEFDPAINDVSQAFRLDPRNAVLLDNRVPRV